MRLAGVIALSDPPRPDASDLVAELLALGVKTVMVTGDAAATAAIIARAVKLDGPVCPPGPIPKGVPVNLLANLQPLPETSDPLERIVHVEKLVRLLIRLKHDLLVMPKSATDAQLLKIFANSGN